MMDNKLCALDNNYNLYINERARQKSFPLDNTKQRKT